MTSREKQEYEHAQVMRWQAADAKHQQALGKSRQRFVAVQALQEVAEQARPQAPVILGPQERQRHAQDMDVLRTLQVHRIGIEPSPSRIPRHCRGSGTHPVP